MNAGTLRARTIVFALVAAVVVAFGVYRWTSNENREPPAPSTPLLTRSPSATVSRTEPPSTTAQPSPDATSAGGRDRRAPSPETRPTPAVFDLGKLAASPQPQERETDEERFSTNRWFTQDDRAHPERYFDLAERMPELNRPEERRDTLEYFLAYRAKLQRDLAAAGDDTDKRQEILATIERYETAISRLRKLIQGEGAQ